MKGKLCGLSLFLLLLLAPCYAHAQQEPDTQTSQYLNIRDNLMSIREQSVALSTELLMLQEQLSVSEAERTLLRAQSTQLSTSLMNINERLTCSYENILTLEHRLRLAYRTVLVLLVLLAIRLVSLIIGIVAYIRGIRLPRWLDILL